MKGLSKLSLAFASGSVGGLVTALLLYLASALGLLKAYAVTFSPHLDAQWLYGYIVWGGVFGSLFALPWLDKSSWILSVLIYSFVPILAFFFVIFPLILHSGIFGQGFGINMPYFVVLFSLLWAFFTSLWLRLCK